MLNYLKNYFKDLPNIATVLGDEIDLRCSIRLSCLLYWTYTDVCKAVTTFGSL
jgi:hypothetical protein